MSVNDAIQNLVTLAECRLAVVPGYCRSTVAARVNDILSPIHSDIRNTYELSPAVYHELMHRTASALFEWLKLEHQAGFFLDTNISYSVSAPVRVHKVKAEASEGDYTPYTPVRIRCRLAPFRGLVFKLPWGHLMARIVQLEIDAVERSAAVKEGKATVDEDGKLTGFAHPIDMARMVRRGKEKFELDLLDFVQAALGQE